MRVNNQDWGLTSGFAFRLRQAREDAGLSRYKAAAVTGTCGNYLYKLECGEVVPNIKRVVDLADLYGVSVDWLLGRKSK